MTAASSGIVTFLMTDVEDSTGKWERFPEAMRHATQRLDNLIKEAVEQNNGSVLKARGEGDSHFAVFHNPLSGVQAAVRAQTTIHREPWPPGCELRVRIAVHTGPCTQVEGDYHGTTPNRCAKIRRHAHGGQLLISATVKQHVGEKLADGSRVVYVGEYVVSGNPEPDAMYQVIPAALEGDTRILYLGSRGSTLLPRHLSTFIGRRGELAELRAAMARSRLVVLVGSGGSGKTRLAVQYLRELDHPPADGYVYVSLEDLEATRTVSAAVAQELGADESTGMGPSRAVKHRIGISELLLVLDNCEPRAAEVGSLVNDLLADCPNLRILATSRSRLDTPGARVFHVTPLTTPPSSEVDAEALHQYDAVQLFADRAQMVADHFALTEKNIGLVAELCRRLDGLPLAIELAAGAAAYMSPADMLARLPRELGHSATGVLPERHRSLETVFESSYALLGPDEAALFDCLSIFGGSFTLRDVEDLVLHIVQVDEVTYEGLGALVDKSLIAPELTTSAEARFRMLSTIRDFARERLRQRGWLDALGLWHAAYFADQVERLVDTNRREGDDWLTALDLRMRNIQETIDWALEHGHAEVAGRVGVRLWEYWQRRGRSSEGRRIIERILPLVESDGSADHAARLYRGLGSLSFHQGDLPGAAKAYDDGLRVAEALADPELTLVFRLNLGITQFHLGQLEQARDQLSTGLEEIESRGLTRYLAGTLYNLGLISWNLGDARTATKLLRRCRREAMRREDRLSAAQAENVLGLVAVDRGEFRGAEGYYRAARDNFAEISDAAGVFSADLSLSELARLRGRHDACLSMTARIIEEAEQIGDRWLATDAHQERGYCYLDAGDTARAESELSLALKSYVATDQTLGECRSLLGLARTSLMRQDLELAQERFEEALNRSKEIDDHKEMLKATTGLASVAYHLGRLEEAATGLGYALSEHHAMGHVPRTVTGIEHAAVLASKQGEQEIVLRLVAAADAHRARIGYPRPAYIRADVDQAEAVARAAVGAETARLAVVEGGNLSIDGAVRLVLHREAAPASA